ncbi:MAG TPA: 3-hydroxyacyl-CoA dehydrogenase NAD-binding domain-containing protein [Solirubrobacteraceae bacterium]|jgi:3-hydroxybutyryl-CoA dehydrogenase
MTPEAVTEPRVAVVGSGVMGAAIALVLARGGSPVALYDPVPEALTAALERIRHGAGLLGGDPEAPLARVRTTTHLADAVADAQLVIEAGPEVPAVKQGIFASVSELAPPDAVLASNTSAIPIREIAARARGRERVLGTHFWNPPHLVPLVEVVQSDATDPRHIEWTMALLARCDLEPVHVKADVPGFVGNRLQHALKREAIALVAAGVCDAETLDTVVKEGFGARLGAIGPLEQADLGGLNLTLQIHEVVMPALDNTPEPHPLLRHKVARGELGARTGRGFREWQPGEAEALRARVDTALLDAAQRRARRGRRGGRDTATGLAHAPIGPTVSPADHGGDALWGLGGLWIIRVSASATGGTFSLIEVQMVRGCATPLHRHELDDETFIVLDGSLALLVSGQRVDAGPGDIVHLPGGEVHAWRVESDEARFLIIATPQHEAFYRDASVPAPALTQPPNPGVLDLDVIRAAAARHGVELLAPPPPY